MRLYELEAELRAGRKVRRKGWQCPSSCVHLETNLRYEDAVATDWELVPEPDPCEEAWERDTDGIAFFAYTDEQCSASQSKRWFRRGWQACEDKLREDAT
jgi:hypothetical protein